MKAKLFRAIAFLSVLIVFLTSLSPLPVFAATVYHTLDPGWFEVYSENFDEGTGDWSALGGTADVKMDSRYSKSGSYSLLVSNRPEMWAGPSKDVSDILYAGKEYRFDAFIRQDSTERNTVSLIIKYTIRGAADPVYDQIASIELTAEGWDRISGYYTIPDDASDFLIYFEHSDKSVSFAIDAVLISANEASNVTTVAKEYQEISYGFEEGTDNWHAYKDAHVERSSNFSYTGRYSLYTSERTSTESVPAINLTSLVSHGISYEYSAFVMYNGRSFNDEHEFRLIISYMTGDTKQEKVLDAKTLQKSNWSKLTGEFILPDDASAVNLLITSGESEESDGYVAYYIDDILILDSTIKNQLKSSAVALRVLIIIGIVFFMAVMFILMLKKINASNNLLADAVTDSMTRALNRNSYEMQIAHLENYPADCRKLWITVCDVNFLKLINDNYGHRKGDDAIIRCADVIISVIGRKGRVYRTGGDEFVCMTGSDVTEKLRQAIAVEAQNYKGYPFSVAVGASSYHPDEDGSEPNIKIILERSDKEMYKDKDRIKKEMSGMM
ncbi:MAG: carbohydrate binding domain-containing protein [Oscillospiraceae bacterium]|nr:carbohydrate binding domain-containing protein [Oscillospiraceae bacterium]